MRGAGKENWTRRRDGVVYGSQGGWEFEEKAEEGRLGWVGAWEGVEWNVQTRC
jgi:hypothetical protein